MIWDVEFSQEACNYVIDSHPYNENVLVAIERLALNPDGLPSEGSYQIWEDWCIWEIAGHTVVYQKDAVISHLYIWVIKLSD
jgi:hypothetical protein